MVTTVTRETLAEFIHDISAQVIKDNSVIVETVSKDDAYISSEKYLSWSDNTLYDMSTRSWKDAFFADLKWE